MITLRAPGAIVVCVAVLLLAGCSTTPKATTTTTTQRSSASRTPTPSLPKTVPNEPNLRPDVSLTTCTAVPGGWKAGGTASNPGKSTASYLITIYFTDLEATVVGYAQTKVMVAAGKTGQWSASSKFTAPAKTLCVLSGVG